MFSDRRVVVLPELEFHRRGRQYSSRTAGRFRRGYPRPPPSTPCRHSPRPSLEARPTVSVQEDQPPGNDSGATALALPHPGPCHRAEKIMGIGCRHAMVQPVMQGTEHPSRIYLLGYQLYRIPLRPRRRIEDIQVRTPMVPGCPGESRPPKDCEDQFLFAQSTDLQGLGLAT